jgi:hypothetical protein
MNILQILPAAALLLLGRRLFWLAVGILGFLFGFDLVTYRLTDWPGWSAWLVAVALGVLCALGAIFLQRISFGIAGFLAGGFLLVKLLTALGVQQAPAPGLFFVLGGVIGAVLAIVSVDLVLVVLTSLVGAAVISEEVGAGPWVSSLLFVGLSLVGIAVQTAALHRKDERHAR